MLLPLSAALSSCFCLTTTRVRQQLGSPCSINQTRRVAIMGHPVDCHASCTCHLQNHAGNVLETSSELVRLVCESYCLPPQAAAERADAVEARARDLGAEVWSVLNIQLGYFTLPTAHSWKTCSS